MDRVTGDISSIKKIDGGVSPNKKISGNITLSEEVGVVGNILPIDRIDGNVSNAQTINGNITYGNGGDSTVPVYDGIYEVTPLAFKQTTLNTNGKLMKNNVLVKEIPYYETSNLSGGNTVYIAGRVEFG